MLNDKHLSSRYRILEVTCEADLEELLTLMWPTKAIPASELYERFENPLDIAVIKSDLGYPRNWYTPKELAQYFWMRSNYNGQEEKDRYLENE